MNRIEKTFQQRQPFVGYLTAGDGGIDYFIACALALIEGGVDILEIGFPFSDPIADGPVIERAHHRALKEGATSDTLLEIARRLREKTDIPLILFSYFNPLLQKGEAYLHALKSAGFDAVLVVDLPVSFPNSDPFFSSLKEAKLLPILLVTPSTNPERLNLINKSAQGFLYYVSQKGTTGVRTELASDFAAQLSRIRTHTKLPIAAGFGIADPKSAKAALDHADGFVVGSAFVKLMEEQVNPKELQLLAQTIDPRCKKRNSFHD